MSAAIVWLRRDLRVADHAALRAACDRHSEVAVVFCVDDRLLAVSAHRTRFLLECLADVDRSLRERGGALVVRHGDPAVLLPAIAREIGAREVHVSRELTPFARARGRRVAGACAAAGIELHTHPGLCATDVTRIATRLGGPYRVFTPFYRSWLTAPRAAVLDAPAHVPLPAGLDPGYPPTLDVSMSLRLPGGERAALNQIEHFAVEEAGEYPTTTTQLSPYLHFGAISPRTVEERLNEHPAVIRQLCWRDFFIALLHHHPENLALELQPRYRAMSWRGEGEEFLAWTRGLTGYPLVDAAMRELTSTGWISNRMRMVVGSFLTKDLGIDWRLGERWFMAQLIDGDVAVNNGNWQWIASVGSDPQPVSRRLFSPTRQQERFDPDGEYVRQWVPELTALPNEHLPEPWRAPLEVQRASGVVIGRDYPAPIVDHAIARREALDRYRALD